MTTSNKLQLPNVTFIALTGIYYDVEGIQNAIDKSTEGVKFGAVKVIGDQAIDNVDTWNKMIIYDLWKYVDTEFAFLFHGDGYVINPDLWRDEFLDYDYVGAPWPEPRWDGEFADEFGDVYRVGNSVGLRSRRLMEAPTRYDFKWRPYYGNTHEDGFLCVHNRKRLEALDMKFAPLEVAKHFSKEHEVPENKNLKTFAYHDPN